MPGHSLLFQVRYFFPYYYIILLIFISRYGWCGTGSTWCASGCQSQFGKCDAVPTAPAVPTLSGPNQPCGSGKSTCAAGLCCSQYGFWYDLHSLKCVSLLNNFNSGTGDAWCGTGCQPAFGICGVTKVCLCFIILFVDSINHSLP